jgi:hypothetical protein
LDIASWLRGLGLEQYEGAFRENRVGADILPSLTAEDLRDLGVIRWSAIAAGCSTPSPPCGKALDRRSRPARHPLPPGCPVGPSGGS